MLSCGVYGNIIRVLISLTAPDELIDEGLATVEECLESLVAETF